MNVDAVQAALRRHGLQVSSQVAAGVASFLATDPPAWTDFTVTGRELISGLPIETRLFVGQLRGTDGLP